MGMMTAHRLTPHRSLLQSLRTPRRHAVAVTKHRRLPGQRPAATCFGLGLGGGRTRLRGGASTRSRSGLSPWRPSDSGDSSFRECDARQLEHMRGRRAWRRWRRAGRSWVWRTRTAAPR